MVRRRVRTIRRNTLVTKDHFDFLVGALAVVKRQRREREGPDGPQSAPIPSMEQVANEMDDALSALRIMGYTVVPKGLVDSFKRSLNTIP